MTTLRTILAMQNLRSNLRWDELTVTDLPKALKRDSIYYIDMLF